MVKPESWAWHSEGLPPLHGDATSACATRTEEAVSAVRGYGVEIANSESPRCGVRGAVALAEWGVERGTWNVAHITCMQPGPFFFFFFLVATHASTLAW